MSLVVHEHPPTPGVQLGVQGELSWIDIRPAVPLPAGVYWTTKQGDHPLADRPLLPHAHCGSRLLLGVVLLSYLLLCLRELFDRGKRVFYGRVDRLADRD